MYAIRSYYEQVISSVAENIQTESEYFRKEVSTNNSSDYSEKFQTATKTRAANIPFIKGVITSYSIHYTKLYENKEGKRVGQKVNPVGLRVGIIRDWESKWYAGKDFGDLLLEDVKIREHLKNKLKDSAVSRIEIERAANRVNVTISYNFV